MLPSNLEPSWIRCLFGLDSFPPGCGLHVMYKVGEEMKIGNFISFSLSHNESQVLGLTLDLAGFRFLFSLVPKEQAFNRTIRTSQTSRIGTDRTTKILLHRNSTSFGNRHALKSRLDSMSNKGSVFLQTTNEAFQTVFESSVLSSSLVLRKQGL